MYQIRSPYLEKQHQRLLSFDQQAPPHHWSRRGVILRRRLCTQPWGLFWFLFIVWLVISPKFRFRNFNGFGLFFGYQSVHIGHPPLIFIYDLYWPFFLKKQFQKKGKLSQDGLQPLHKNQYWSFDRCWNSRQDLIPCFTPHNW